VGVTAALVSRGLDVDGLRNDLIRCIEELTPVVAPDREVDTQPTLGFQRVIQRAILKVQSSGRQEVTSADILEAMFGEKKAHAVSLLFKYNVTPLVTNADTGELGEAAEVQIVLFNDDVTPMEFVVNVLERFFFMNRQEATEVMLEVHRQGSAVCGLYAREAAEPIVKAVLAYSRSQSWPLRCAMVVPK
jgi:ATP-dependent Clp protease adapter protein ClpS